MPESGRIHAWDWHRILLGDSPPGFFLELCGRVVVTYLVLMVGMRLLGTRMAGQVNRTQMAAVVSLAAAIGIPMLTPEQGILGAVAIAVVILAWEWLIAAVSFSHPRVEEFIQGTPTLLVRDGVLQWERMRPVRITRERVFAQVRSRGLIHLGQIQRFWLEANGSFTLLRAEKPEPGLCVIPDWDAQFRGGCEPKPESPVCRSCGLPGKNGNDHACPNCGRTGVVSAVY